MDSAYSTKLKKKSFPEKHQDIDTVFKNLGICSLARQNCDGNITTPFSYQKSNAQASICKLKWYVCPSS